MRLAVARIAKRDALHDQAPRRCGLRRCNQVARAFTADACIGSIGGRDARLIEFARQIGELMDHRLGLGGAHRRAGCLRVEDVEHHCRHAGAFEFASLLCRACYPGDVVSGAQEQRHQPAADRACGTCEKHSHWLMLADLCRHSRARRTRESGIHKHGHGYGFRARRFRAPANDGKSAHLPLCAF